MTSSKKSKARKKRPVDLSETQLLEIIEKQPEEVQESLTRTLVAQQVSYRGPIPPPSLLKEFDSIIPNGADRIMTMAEKQQSHRQELEKDVVKANNRDSLVGVISAALIGSIAIIGGIALMMADKSVEGFGVIIPSIATLVGVYLHGAKRDADDLKNKQQED